MGASNEPRSIWARGLRSHPGVLGSAVGHEEPLQTVAVLEEMLASGWKRCWQVGSGLSKYESQGSTLWMDE